MQPTVSVIVPTYNRQQYLTRALNSIFAQTYVDYEVIVVDDGSTDGTVEWLGVKYPQVKLIQLKENRGAVVARNVGIKAAQGKFIAFLDNDDQWLSEYLQFQVQVLMKQPECVLVYCNYISVIEGKKKEGKIKLDPLDQNLTISMLLGNFIHTLSQAVIRASLFQEVGLFDEGFKICHDKEFYLRAFAVGKAAHVEEYLVKKYWLPNSLLASSECQDWLADGLKMLDIFYSKPENDAYLHLKTAAEKSLRQSIRSFQKFYSKALETP